MDIDSHRRCYWYLVREIRERTDKIDELKRERKVLRRRMYYHKKKLREAGEEV